MRVGIADTVPTGIARATAEGISEATMALDGYTDIGEFSKALMKEGVASRNGPLLLSAFWASFSDQVKIEPVHSRLLINPPSGLTSLGEGQLFTILDAKGGSYGSPFKFDPLVVSQIKGAFDGYFDDVAVFYVKDEPYSSAPSIGMMLNSVILPGSTLTLIRPNLKKHGFWMAWAELDLNFVPFLRSVKTNFGYKTVLDQDYDDFTVTILGIEAK